MKEYKVGDIFGLDEEYPDRAQWCNNNSCVIVEIEQDDNGERKFEIQEIPAPSEVELLYKEFNELDSWFVNYYDLQVKQYDRCKRLGIKYDKDINALDEKAVKTAARIKEIKIKLGL